MNFIEAMRKIDNDGCKIRRKVWCEDIFIISRERIVLENDGSLCDFSFNDYFADDWEEYVSPTNFEKAIVAYKEGKLIYRVSNPLSRYILSKRTANHYSQVLSFNNLDILANDWVITDKEDK
jgi:hypothetical protein